MRSAGRLVVFDGGMGATLEQFDLTAEDYGGLPGKCHEALILNRPDVIEGVHAAMVEAGAEVVETNTFQASRAQARRVGPRRPHARDQRQGGRDRPPGRSASERFVAGSIGPTGILPASDDPTLGNITFRELVDVFAEQAQGLVEGGVDLLIIETAQDILEVKAAIFGAREAFKRDRPHACRSRLASRCCPTAARCCSAPTSTRALTTLEALGVDVDRPELLDRPRGHARRDPLPRRVLARCPSTASRTPACRCRARTARRSSPRQPGAARRRRSASSSSATA